MQTLALIALALAAPSVSGHNQAASTLRNVRAVRSGDSSSFVKAVQFKHSLRVCNAYPYATPLDVYRGKDEKISSSPLAYKACEDFSVPIKAGDRIEFRVGDASAGTFSVADLPRSDAVLLLVIHRHDTLSTAVAFESHVFASLLNAQVAVIDTFKGTSKASLKIKDHDDASQKRAEQLRFNSVVAVNPGKYELSLASLTGEEKSNAELVALNKESYVVMRVGVEAQQGPSYAQEIVVFPNSDAKLLHSGAMRSSVYSALVTMLALALFRRE